MYCTFLYSAEGFAGMLRGRRLLGWLQADVNATQTAESDEHVEF